MTAAWGALLRLARRDVRRNLARSLLVVALIALPVGGVVAATTWFFTTRVAPAEQATQALGDADLAIYASDAAAPVPQPSDSLPEGARVAPLWRGEIQVQPQSPGSEPAAVEALGVDLGGLGRGMFETVSGAAPRHADEVALTTELAERLGLSVGDVVSATGNRMTVVGLVRDPTALDRQALVMAATGAPASSGFLVKLPSGTDATAFARVLERGGWDVTTRAEVSRADPEQLLFILVLGGFGFLVAILVAAAAFAVSAQRRQHELALLAASGADARHLRRSVLSGALLLGATGSVAGVAAGVAIVAATLPWLEAWTNRAVDGLAVSPSVLTGAALAGVVASLVSSWFTARAAGHTPVAAALTGRRPPRTSSARLLVGGTVITVLGIAVTGATAAGAASGTGEVLTALGLLAGAGLTMVGLGAISPWLAEHVTRQLGTRLPIGIRLAMRDTARFRSRTGPIVMAIVAGLGVSVAVGATLDTIETGLANNYRPQLDDDQLLVDGPAPVPLVEELHDTLPVTSAARLTIIAPVDRNSPRPLPQFVTVADARLLDTIDAPADATQALASGQVLALYERNQSDPEALVEQARVIAPDGVHPVPLDLLPQAVPPIVLSPETLADTGVETGREGSRWLLRLARPLSDEQLQQARELAANFGQRITVETGPPQIASVAIQTAATAGAGLLSLLIVGVGLALIAAETRHDDSILVAVGASPRVRRTLAAARAGTLALLGAVLAVPAGLLPIWGLASATDTGAAAGGVTIPVLSIGVVMLGVPAIAAALAWALTRPAPTTLTPDAW